MLFCNVHMLMLSQEDDDLASAMSMADFVFPDGAPIAWLQRRLGHKDADMMRGEWSVELLCEKAAEQGLSLGFFGATEDVVSALVKSLSCQFPGISIDYTYAPGVIGNPPGFDPELAESINTQQLDALFIGLGCPKQEKWATLYAPHLNCSLLAVGAAFDWLAGTTKKPPAWMERAGLAWLFRLIQNPSKMFHRYLIYNSKFIYQAAKLLLFKRPQ